MYGETSFRRGSVTSRKKCFSLKDDGNMSYCSEEYLNEMLYSPQSEFMPVFYQKPKCSLRNCCFLFLFKIGLYGDHPLLDVRLWFMAVGVFFCMLGTIVMFVVYKDLCEFFGVVEHYTTCLCLLGVGDICGRISGGVIASLKCAKPILLYSVAILICAGIISCYVFVFNGAGIIILSLCYGMIYGGQNVLLAVAPTVAFGREKLAAVFGYILFMGGLGALFGAPLAGLF